MAGRFATLTGLAVALLSAALSALSLQDAAVAKMSASHDGAGASRAASVASAGAGDVPSRFLRCAGTNEGARAQRAFALLGSLNPALDYENWFKHLQEADDASKKALECSPGDGTLWAYRAYLMRQAVTDPRRIVEMLEKSRQLSPSLARAVVTRAATWWSLPQTSFGDPEIRKARDRDILLFVRQAHPPLLVDLIRNAPSGIRQEILHIHEGSPPKRKEELEYAMRMSASKDGQRDPFAPATGGQKPNDNSLFDLLGERPRFD